VNPTQEIESGLVHSCLEITKVVHTESNTGEASDTDITELDIEEPKYEFSQLESPSVALAPTPEPPSPRRKLIITFALPLGLISIKDITGNEEIETPHSPFIGSEYFDPRVPFSPFQPNPWYFTTLNFLSQNLSPPHIHF